MRSRPRRRCFGERRSTAPALTLRVCGDTDADSIRTTLVRLHDARVPVSNLRIVTPDLDDVFFALTGSIQENHA